MSFTFDARQIEGSAQPRPLAEQRLEQLVEGQTRIHHELIQLARMVRAEAVEAARARENLRNTSEVLGVLTEELAEDVLLRVLSERGYRVLGPTFSLSLDGEEDDVDLVVAIEGEDRWYAWALVETKSVSG